MLGALVWDRLMLEAPLAKSPCPCHATCLHGAELQLHVSLVSCHVLLSDHFEGACHRGTVPDPSCQGAASSSPGLSPRLFYSADVQGLP